MVKTTKLPDRPKTPNRQQITEDLDAVSDDDVIFRDLNTGSVPTADDELSPGSAKGAEGEAILTPANPDDAVPSSSADVTYKHVTRLIKLHGELEKEPKLLQEKYENLQKLSADVADSITELRTAAESVATKS